MIMSSVSTNIKYPQNLIDAMNEMIQIQNPCFVFGECGKTQFIRLLSPEVRIYDSREILEPKNLGGFYAIVENQIIYVNGILAEAMTRGLHICFKRIDTNRNLLNYLRPVIDSRVLVLNSGKEICAHEHFRIFFTCSEAFDFRNVAFVGKIEFTFRNTIGTFGSCGEVVENLFDFINSHSPVKCPKTTGNCCDLPCLKEVHKCQCRLKEILCSSHFRMFSELRETLFLFDQNLDKSSHSFRSMLYQCFVNIFLKHESRTLAEKLYISYDPLTLPNMLFAKTEPVEAALRSLILNIKKKKPTLLVGETGAGKTALIQYLCANSKYFFGFDVQLKILNMSSDFDGSDLIGGYQSIDFDKKIRSLYCKSQMELPKCLDKKVILKHLFDRSTGATQEEAKTLLSILDKKVPFYYKKGILTEAMKNGSWILMDEINLCSKETLNLLEAVLAKKEMVLYDSGDFSPIEVHPNFMVFACMNPYGDFGKNKYDSEVFNKIIFYDFSYSEKCIRSVVQSISKNFIEQVDEIASFYYDLRKAIVNKEYSNFIEPLISGRTLCRALNLIMSLKNDPDSIYNSFNLLFFTQLDLSSRSQAINLFKKHFKYLPETPSFSSLEEIDEFIITPKVRIHLRDVELAVKANLPVLLQGDTSTGKTSLILALARKHGRRIIRINNHEHTECSDYIGNFLSTQDGISFVEGPLINAMRKGYWIILDELNLAPSDVLEVLNRLLDDNREIYIPEVDEIVRPHQNFRIFATQNLNYSGRHGLAKSFRNRFIEIFFAEKDETEIKEILEKSFKLPLSFIKIMLSIYSTLKVQRSFNNFTTLRDLFKWAKRTPTGYYDLFEIGMNIIYERQRNAEDRKIVLDAFLDSFKERIRIEKKDYIETYRSSNKIQDFIANDGLFTAATQNLILTPSYLRLIDLVYKAWANYEAVLLIGETGIGKTRICEVVSALFKVSLKSINVHSGTEGSDFIGHSILDKDEIRWKDGPLVEAMQHGNAFLIDEINLADDSVLERLNSLLESKRMLFIAETGRDITAHDTFRIVSTMNPSGDYGKRELSPALRSRFTEIYFELENVEYLAIFNSLMSKMSLSREYLEYFIAGFQDLGNMTVRKIELVCCHIANLTSGTSCNDIKELTQESSSLIFKDKVENKEGVWDEVVEILGIRTKQIYDFVETDLHFGVAPYYAKKKYPGSTSFNFDTETSKVNLQRILRVLTLNRGILLEGEPGCGKTSIIQNIAKFCGIPVLRINLSEQTEMSDLVGSYLPVGSSIKFVESELISFVRKGFWIILDEINLCTQSVIEGLNCILDHRRSIDVDGEIVHSHPSTRIFGTMNPSNKLNGRKKLPKSFLDRFIIISMDSYSEADIRDILRKSYGDGFEFDSGLSLRGNLKINELKFLKSNDIFTVVPYAGDTCTYAFGDCSGRIGNMQFAFKSLPHSYTLVHSQLPQVELLLKCICKNIPVILNGTTGRSSLLKFISQVLDLESIQINCHTETDTCDLLGQYQKSDSLDSQMLFKWENSSLIKRLGQGGLIVFNNPELVEKSIFDRLNGVFEGDNTINIYEKGVDSIHTIHKTCRFILCCDNPFSLSPALLDRCISIDLSNDYSYIDLYKIFIQRPDNILNSNKKVCAFKTIDFFRSFLGIDLTVFESNLDLEIKKYSAFGTLPRYLNKSLNVYNALMESEIDSMFYVDQNKAIDFDSCLLEKYKFVQSFALKLPQSLEEKMNCLINCPNTVSFVKSLDFNNSSLVCSDALNELSTSGIENMCFINCKEIPDSVFAYKYRFLLNLRDKKLRDFKDVCYFAQNVSKIPEIANIEFNFDLFKDLVASDSDPLEIVKIEFMNEKIHKENLLVARISECVKEIYKYFGHKNSHFSRLKDLFQEYDELHEYYSKIIMNIDKRLKRDYRKFKQVISSVTFCDYLNNSKIREFLDVFNDISDYFLVHLFNTRNQCQRCHKRSNLLSLNEGSESSGQLSLRLIRTGAYQRCLKYEYAKYLYNHLLNIRQSPTNLVLEAICFSEPFDPDLRLEFTENELDLVFSSLIPEETVARIIEVNSHCITLGKDFVKCLSSIQHLPESLLDLSIFSTPEGVINEIQSIKSQNETRTISLVSEEIFHRSLQQIIEIEKFLKSLYKSPFVLNVEKNYRYFQYLVYNTVDEGMLQRFFFDSSVYEFLDRMFFATSFLQLHASDFLYNSILLYKAFDLESLNDKRKKEAGIKLRKDPRLFESTISQYVDRFLYLPVTSLLKIVFEAPKCQNLHAQGYPCFLFDLLPKHLVSGKGDQDTDNSLCECALWVELSSKSHQKTVADCVLANAKCYSKHSSLSKEHVLSCFYRRRLPEISNRFGYSEICLSKTLNNVVNNLNESKYDEKTSTILLELLLLAFDYPFPPFLYFIYKVSEQFEDSFDNEEGVGLKSGEGQSHIDDKNIKEEDIVDDIDDNNKKDLDSEGVEMDNEGELHDVSGESEGELGVDPSDNECSDSNDMKDDDVKDLGTNNDEEGTGKDEYEETGNHEEGDDENTGGEEESDEGVIEDSCSQTEANDLGPETISQTESDDADSAISDQDSNAEMQYTYEWKESALNRNQTCQNADGYGRKVEGGNLDFKDALKEGEGEEFVEGEGEAGKEVLPFTKTVSFDQQPSDCTKLLNLLRIVFESNKLSKYKGDYKTGKKLNLKKIVPYIASDYRKDKIWMKRQKSDKKEYLLRIFIDNSKSMFDQNLINTLSSVYYKINSVFSQLNIPVELYKFGSELRECTVEDLTFDEDSTLINWTDNFEDGINIILTDGIFQNVGYAKSNFLVVMIDKGHVRKMSKVSVVENKVFIEKYLDSFALKYCILQNIEDLEKVFVEALAGILKSLQ